MTLVKAVDICGSGIIDLIAQMRLNGWINIAGDLEPAASDQIRYLEDEQQYAAIYATETESATGHIIIFAKNLLTLPQRYGLYWYQTGGNSMKTVTEVSRLTGVSVRTLHHYDAIGLLKPTEVTTAGYRLYDDTALRRLQTILLFRELQFPLKEIKEILDSPEFDPKEALAQQIRLLELQRQHLDDLISHARNIQTTGVTLMDFTPFDRSEIDAYAAQAKRKWGKTDAYREFEQKTAGQTTAQMESTGDALMAIFAEIGAIRHLSPASEAAQALVSKLQNYITEHYYTCTKQILRGLGQMYIAGDSMTENIDKAGGEGTAEFTHKAIEIYCN